MSRPALFLDRDGVINREVGYLHRFEDVEFVPGILPVLRTANALGIFTCVVTNQAGIGRGLYTEADFHKLMRSMQSALRAGGGELNGVYFSPFHPVHGLGDYRRETDCRKPAPGMLLRAAREHDLDLQRSIMVGDRCSDIAAGAAAGVPRLFLLKGLEQAACDSLQYTPLNSLTELLPHLGSNPLPRSRDETPIHDSSVN